MQRMAVASGLAGRVLARPLFCGHMRALKTREVVYKTRIQAVWENGCLYHRANFTDKKVTLRKDIQPSVYSTAIPYCDEALLPAVGVGS